MGMTRRLHNWSYNNVTDFLKENGFSFYKEVGGSHEAWIKRGDNKVPDRVVGMHFTSKIYLIGTMKRMIRESGIGEDEWIKWASS
jgi:predicted RNA binding protein YcfA (HicA-like mRNA interferase family)